MTRPSKLQKSETGAASGIIMSPPMLPSVPAINAPVGPLSNAPKPADTPATVPFGMEAMGKLEQAVSTTVEIKYES